MEKVIVSGGKVLRCGITTGTCAAAAAQAAAYRLLIGAPMNASRVTLPNGECVSVPVEAIDIHDGEAVASVIKDAGDDPDITNGVRVIARVTLTEGGGITIDGGKGVGRVTLPGLDQPVGAAAINSTPRRMIEKAVRDVVQLADCSTGLRVVIEIPEGEALARRTFNPRLGIVGGLSILGTTGIVEPMSEKALVDTIRLETRVRAQCGKSTVLFTPGNYGLDHIKTLANITDESVIRISNFIGDSLEEAADQGFEEILLVGHLGKLVKLAGGMFNTHSKYGDMRMEVLTSHAALQGLSRQAAMDVMRAATVDAALDLLEGEIDLTDLMKSVLETSEKQIEHRFQHPVRLLYYTNARGTLIKSGGFDAAFQRFLEEENAWYTLSEPGQVPST